MLGVPRTRSDPQNTNCVFGKTDKMLTLLSRTGLQQAAVGKGTRTLVDTPLACFMCTRTSALARQTWAVGDPGDNDGKRSTEDA